MIKYINNNKYNLNIYNTNYKIEINNELDV